MTDPAHDTAEHDVTSEFAEQVADPTGCHRHPERKATHKVTHPMRDVLMCRACTAELRHAADITPDPDAARAAIKEI